MFSNNPNYMNRLSIALDCFRSLANRPTRWERIRFMLCREPNTIHSEAVNVGYCGFDGIVQSDGGKTLFIGVPGICRVFLYSNGTYKIDIPNVEIKKRKGSL